MNRQLKSSTDVNPSVPELLRLEHPFVIWFTGLPSAGKTTLAAALTSRLRKTGAKVEHLDGDELRACFTGTGFTPAERDRHVRQAGYIAALLERNGVVAVVSLISPYRAARDAARRFCKYFVEIHVATTLAQCQSRDVKGLYEKASRGELAGLTGLNAPYEPPLAPELRIDTEGKTIDACVETIWAHLFENQHLGIN